MLYNHNHNYLKRCVGVYSLTIWAIIKKYHVKEYKVEMVTEVKASGIACLGCAAGFMVWLLT